MHVHLHLPATQSVQSDDPRDEDSGRSEVFNECKPGVLNVCA